MRDIALHLLHILGLQAFDDASRHLRSKGPKKQKFGFQAGRRPSLSIILASTADDNRCQAQ